MGRLKKTLDFLKEDTDRAREIITQIEGTLVNSTHIFSDAAKFKEEIINGYLAYYIVECKKQAVKDGTDNEICSMYLYSVYNLFTKKEVTEEVELSRVRDAIRSKYGTAVDTTI